jgi:malate dehydrogenase
MVASGMLFPGRKIALHLLEIPEFSAQIEGLKMELEDCAFLDVAEIKVGTDPFELFRDIDVAFLVGAKPRGPGMERKELLQANGNIFQKQGQALDQVAKKDVRVLVVGNPCNTNCLIAIHNAPSLSPKQFASLSTLDENRAKSIIAKKAGVMVENLSHVTIWGNHSSTLVVDADATTIEGKPLQNFVDQQWLYNDCNQRVQQRGAEIIKIRGKSSAASAARSSVQAMRRLFCEEDTIFSMGVYADDNPYGIDKDLVFSFPCHCNNGSIAIYPDLRISQELLQKIKLTERELIEERAAIQHLLG